MVRILVILVTFLLLIAIILLKKKTNFNVNRCIKILAVCYFLLCFFKMFFADGFIWVINGGFYGGTLYEKTDILQTLLRWAMYFSSGAITVACFTNVKVFKNFAIYICLPLMIVSLYFFPDFMEYYMDGTGRGIKACYEIRATILALEFILGILIPLLLRISQGYKFGIKNKTEWFNFLIVSPLIILSMFPVYTIQSLFGYTGIIVGMFKTSTIIWVICSVAIILLLIKLFKRRPYEQKFALSLWLCIILFMHYNSLYLMGFSIERLPIQLCNLGAYFFIVCLIIKSRKFFDFVFVANIVGTIIAMVVPDIDGGIGYFWNIHFMVEHMLVLIVPSVMMGIGIFPRINRSSIKHIYIGFVIYFLFCLISGFVLNVYKDFTGEEVNYFYLFDADLIFAILPSMKFILNTTFIVNGYTFYPLYILGVFVVFSILLYLFYLLVLCIYKVIDDQEEIYENKANFHIYIKELKNKRKKRSKKC